jgi:hypothetical protein
MCRRLIAGLSTFIEKVLPLRRLRRNGWKIAREVKLSRAIVIRILRRAGMNRLRSLDPPPPVIRWTQASRRSYPLRYQAPGSRRQARPSHHGDRTRQIRGPGYEYLYVAIDDHSRIVSRLSCPTRSTVQLSASSTWLVRCSGGARSGFLGGASEWQTKIG